MIKLFKQAVKGIANVMALGINDLVNVDPGGWVTRDADGVPVAWRLFKFGKFTITRNGSEIFGDFTREAADSILAHFAQKGTKIPLDSKHFLYALAEKMKVDESEVVKLLPDGRGTFGYCSLELREDGLWVVDVEYVPLARKLMREGIFRYFSPVFRGLSDGMLRITSVAFTNQPAIDQLDAIAASADEAESFAGDIDSLAASLDAIASANQSSKNMEPRKMDKLLKLIAPLIGMATDSIAMGDDGVLPEPVVQKLTDLAGEVTELRAGKTAQESFLSDVKACLALSDDISLKTAQAAILGLHAKAEGYNGLKQRVDAMALESENRKRDEVVAKGLAAGKLTQAMIDGDWCKGQDAAALSAFLVTAPVVVPLHLVDRTKLKGEDAVALSDDDRKVFEMMGITDPAEQEAAAKL